MTEAMTALSPSLREPQEEPADHCYTILQDHIPWVTDSAPRPFIYTGSAAHVLDVMAGLCQGLAAETGKPTLLAKYTQREDVLFFEGSS